MGGLTRAAEGVGDEAGGLQVLDQCAQEPDGLGALGLRGAHRLPDLHETPLDEPDSRVRAGELGHWLADPGRRFQVLGEEQLGSLPAPHHHRVPQGAAEEQVVGGAVLHADAHTGAVHVGHGGQRGPVGHRVHALDQHVRRGEGHLVGPGGLDPEEADVRPSRQQRRQRIARGVEAEEFDADDEPGGDLAPDIDRHAGRRDGSPLG